MGSGNEWRGDCGADPPAEAGDPPLTLGQRLKLSILGTSPVTVVVTTIFHTCLVLLPFFVLGHNVLLDMAWGASLPSLPEAAAGATCTGRGRRFPRRP